MNVCTIAPLFTDYSERSRLAGFTDYSERLRMHSSALPTKTSSKRVVDYSLIWYRCFSDPFRGHQQIATDYSERLHCSFAYPDPQWTSLLNTVNIIRGCALLWNATDYSECLEQKEVKISVATCWACLNIRQSPLSNADFLAGHHRIPGWIYWLQWIFGSLNAAFWVRLPCSLSVFPLSDHFKAVYLLQWMICWLQWMLIANNWLHFPRPQWIVWRSSP